MSKRRLIADPRYSYAPRNETQLWWDVCKNNEVIALAMNEETARQVIYRDIVKNGNECQYLIDADFETV